MVNDQTGAHTLTEEEQFRQAKRELEQFLVLAMHDLRSPLNSSSVLTQILLRRFGDELDSEARWIAEQIHAQLTQMGALITGLCAFVHAGSTEHENVKVDLNEAVLTARGELKADYPGEQRRSCVRESADGARSP